MTSLMTVDVIENNGRFHKWLSQLCQSHLRWDVLARIITVTWQPYNPGVLPSKASHHCDRDALQAMRLSRLGLELNRLGSRSQTSTCHDKDIDDAAVVLAHTYRAINSFFLSFFLGLSQGRFCPSIDLVCKVEKSALENSSVSFRRSTFRVSFHGFIQKRHRNHSISPKLSVANSFNNEEKLDRRLFKLGVSCGFFNKRYLWKTMHRQTKCYKLTRSTDWNNPQAPSFTGPGKTRDTGFATVRLL